jgi:hypothetical protein
MPRHLKNAYERASLSLLRLVYMSRAASMSRLGPSVSQHKRPIHPVKASIVEQIPYSFLVLDSRRKKCGSL